MSPAGWLSWFCVVVMLSVQYRAFCNKMSRRLDFFTGRAVTYPHFRAHIEIIVVNRSKLKKITTHGDTELELPFWFLCLPLSRWPTTQTRMYNTYIPPTPISYLFHSVNFNNHSKSPMSIINQNSSSSSSNMMDHMVDNRKYKPGQTCTNRDRVNRNTKSISGNSKQKRRRKLFVNQNYRGRYKYGGQRRRKKNNTRNGEIKC